MNETTSDTFKLSFYLVSFFGVLVPQQSKDEDLFSAASNSWRFIIWLKPKSTFAPSSTENA